MAQCRPKKNTSALYNTYSTYFVILRNTHIGLYIAILRYVNANSSPIFVIVNQRSPPFKNACCKDISVRQGSFKDTI